MRGRGTGEEEKDGLPLGRGEIKDKEWRQVKKQVSAKGKEN